MSQLHDTGDELGQARRTLKTEARASDLGLERLSIKAALRLLTEDSGDWKFADRFCPSCGERLVYTSRYFFTCAACWDCRLYPSPKAASMSGDREPFHRGNRLRDDFRRLFDPYERAEVVVAVLAMLDDTEVVPEVTRLLTEARPTPIRRRAAEVLAKFRQAEPACERRHWHPDAKGEARKRGEHQQQGRQQRAIS